MYSEENIKIEEQIQDIVSEYKDYESSTLEKFANESPTVLISLFPELKTNDLVNKQMDVYLANNNELKEQMLKFEVVIFWKIRKLIMKISNLFKDKHERFEEILVDNYECYLKMKDFNEYTMHAFQIYGKLLDIIILN